MASTKEEKLQLKITQRNVKYKKLILKIPEQGIEMDYDYTVLPCLNTHSLLVMYDDFFKILGILYNRRNL